MHHRHRAPATTLALLVALTTAAGTLAVTGTAYATPAATPLPLAAYAHLQADPAHGHLFFTEGKGSTGIVVTDLAGARVTTIADEQGATGLALSPDGTTLYAALADAGAIAAIDTATLKETARWPTGTGSAPVSVAVEAGRVWYGYTADGRGGIGSIDPAAPAPEATPQPAMSHWSTAPLLATGGGVLAAEEPSGSLSHVATFDVSSGTPAAKADTLVYGGTATGLDVTADGAKVRLAAPQQMALQEYRSADLLRTDPGVYFTGGANSAPSALATDEDGTIAVAGTSGVYLYATGGLAENRITFPTGTIAPDGLEWAGDGTTLYAVTRESSGSYTLNVLDAPKLTDTELALTPPKQAVPTLPYTVTGTLSTRGFLPAGARLQVTRDGAPLPDTTVDAQGTFTIGDTRQDEGTYVYGVSYPGDATHRPATATLTVRVARMTTDLIGLDATSVEPGSVVLTGSLLTGLSREPLPQGTTVQVARLNDATGETVQLPPVPVDPATSGFTVTDAPGATGMFTYTLSYEGDVTHAPTTASRSVMIAPYAPALTLKAPATATRGAALAFTGTLGDGPYGTGRTVTITRADAAHTTTPVKWTAPVAADGTVTVKDTPPVGGANTYTVTFPGDATHRAATASATVQVSRAATSLTVAANAATYAYGAKATVTAHLGTTYDGRTVALYATPAGGKKTLVKSGTVDAKGNLTATYALTRNTTFTASYAGDQRYAPATAARGVSTYAKVATVLGGYYTSTTSGGITYRVYHRTVKPTVTATVTPNKAGQCQRFQAQQYYSGAWHTLSTSGCLTLAANSSVRTQLTLTKAVNQKFRVRSQYQRATSDNTNLSTWGAWTYLTVRT
ncbi:hypothetical protein IAG44_18850 [Streptomyces roseirectus]|uniref:Uncharacterized protein n=1 Tax=Streptomyces roseirectus TaxID=2768066 RepID=A0A7H0IES4_9ACTN|nr:hypothetical protein [Streptomyces roseirectus]QNP71290.1 hypothetical protein IAG44_18850 [Streptomyces roseirectus]